MSVLEYIFSLNFLPHLHCFAGDELTLLLNVIGNFTIGTAYMIIPWRLVKFLKRQEPEIIQGRMMVLILFALFIFSCGITHFLDILVIWYPYYRPQTYWVLWTAFISLFTAIYIFKIKKVKITSYQLFDKTMEVTEIQLPIRKIKNHKLKK